MSGMFAYCNNLTSLPDISKWNTNNVSYINGMFFCCNKIQLIPKFSTKK